MRQPFSSVAAKSGHAKLNVCTLYLGEPFKICIGQRWLNIGNFMWFNLIYFNWNCQLALKHIVSIYPPPLIMVPISLHYHHSYNNQFCDSYGQRRAFIVLVNDAQEPCIMCSPGSFSYGNQISGMWTRTRWAVLLTGYAQIEWVTHWVGELEAERGDWLCFLVDSPFAFLHTAVTPNWAYTWSKHSHSSEASWLLACG